MNNKRFNSLDIEELAAHICDFAEDADYDTSDIDEKLMEEFNLDLDNFTQLIHKLSPLLDMAVSPLTEEPFIGFGDGNMWIAKIPHDKFINQVLIWMDYQRIKSGKSEGYERVITSKGKPEFKIVLMKGDQEYRMEKPLSEITQIYNERIRQIEQEGWTLEHDDQHDDQSLLGAAICYAERTLIGEGKTVYNWPWDDKSFKPSNDLANLKKAGALIAAEIARLERKEATNV